MKRVLLAGAVLVGLASAAQSAVYYPTADAFMRSGVATTNYGTTTAHRFLKGGEPYNDLSERLLMNFDWAGIKAATEVELGHALTAADFTSGAVTVKLNITCADDLTSTVTGSVADVPVSDHILGRPFVFQSPSTWSETTATYASPNGDTTQWQSTDGTGYANVRSAVSNSLNANALNTTVHEFSASGVANSFILDPAVAETALTATNVAGIMFLMGNDAYFDNNGYAYTRDQAGTDQDPSLEVTVVPEPASLGLLALGGLALLRRRRA